MDAKTILIEVAEALAHAKLEAVMVGNAAAALQGAPVTTMDIDFCVRESDHTAGQLATVAKELEAELVSFGTFFQVQAPERELYLDFICNVPGVKSFDVLSKRSSRVSFDGIHHLNIAALEDIIAAKKRAGQDKDLAALPILERTLQAINAKNKRTKAKRRRKA